MPPDQVCKLFGWQPDDVARLMDRLAGEGRLERGVRIEGPGGDYLVSAV